MQLQQELEQQETLPTGDDVAIREVRQVQEVVKRIATVRSGKKRSRNKGTDAADDLAVEEELDVALRDMQTEQEDPEPIDKIQSPTDRQVIRHVVVEEEDDPGGDDREERHYGEGQTLAGKHVAPPRQKKKVHRAKKKRIESYKRYLLKILKQIHPELGISSHAMSIMQTFISDHFDRIVSEAAKLTILAKKSTLSAREIQTAVLLVLPGALRDHAVKEGKKAVARAENVGLAY